MHACRDENYLVAFYFATIVLVASTFSSVIFFICCACFPLCCVSPLLGCVSRTIKRHGALRTWLVFCVLEHPVYILPAVALVLLFVVCSSVFTCSNVEDNSGKVIHERVRCWKETRRFYDLWDGDVEYCSCHVNVDDSTVTLVLFLRCNRGGTLFRSVIRGGSKCRKVSMPFALLPCRIV